MGSLGHVTRQIEATITWNMMVTKKNHFQALTNGAKVKLYIAKNCLCGVSYTLGMHIGSLWGLKFSI